MAHARPFSAESFQEITDSTIRKLEDGRPPWLSQAPGYPRGLIANPVPLAGTAACDVESGFHELFAATGIKTDRGAIRTFYTSSRDTIILSDWRAHQDINDLYRDWIHELVHATGHPSRLRRNLPKTFGSHVSAFEDLVVEMSSARICASLGITPALRHRDGVEAWITLLRADSHAWFRAMRSADESTDYLFALRDANAAAFDRLEADEAAAERAFAASEHQIRRECRQRERERWASGSVTGSRPGESLLAARHGDLP